MGRHCYVPSCKTGYHGKQEKVSVFRVPIDKIKQWQKQIPRKDRVLSGSDCICEKHFDPKFIIREVKTATYSYPLQYPKLSVDAIPTIFPGCSKYPSKKIKTRRVIKKADIVSKNVCSTNTEESKNFPCITTCLVNDFENGASCSSDVTIKSEILFDNLWNATVSIKLPSKSWAMHFLNDKDKKIITFSELILLPANNNTVIRKNILLYESSHFNTYIFGTEIKNAVVTLTDTNDECLHTASELEEVLNNFDNLKTCVGCMSIEDLPTFNIETYKKDYCLNVWRHINCTTYINKTPKNNINNCFFCRKFKKSLAYFKHSTKRSEEDKKVILKRRIDNIIRREKRLKLKYTNVRKELTAIRKKIKTIEPLLITPN